MTTRGRLARGEHQQEFQGRVQRWVKQWEPLGLTSKVKVLKWIPTGDRSEPPAASRSLQFKPVRDSSLKVVFRQKLALPGEQSQAGQDIPSSSVVPAAEAEPPRHAFLQPDTAVPMETEAAQSEEAGQLDLTLEQSSLQVQQENADSTAEAQQGMSYAQDKLQHTHSSAQAHEPNRAVAEQAAKETLAALNADPAVPVRTSQAESTAVSG